jgi:large subunit ribosomal protein L4
MISGDCDMKFKTFIMNLDNEKVGEIELSENFFGSSLTVDILTRMVNWQRSCRQSGNHKTRNIHEVSGTTKKPWNQKGTGRARVGSLRVSHFRGGATMFGPRVRSHAHKLPKRIRGLALKSALFLKRSEKQFFVIDNLNIESVKTKDIIVRLNKFPLKNALIIGGKIINDNFSRSISNLPHLNVLPQEGINVYDILRHDSLVLTKDALIYLRNRLGCK